VRRRFCARLSGTADIGVQDTQRVHVTVGTGRMAGVEQLPRFLKGLFQLGRALFELAADVGADQLDAPDPPLRRTRVSCPFAEGPVPMLQVRRGDHGDLPTAVGHDGDLLVERRVEDR
jgi:hypothetical protein